MHQAQRQSLNLDKTRERGVALRLAVENILEPRRRRHRLVQSPPILHQRIDCVPHLVGHLGILPFGC